jgi:bifunctional DNA-binding transcriptional regulator/antitoxin component of YhaV-PrlF toxin-antitoxin module
MGLMPGDKLYIETEQDKIIIRKIPSLLELLDLPPLTKPQTPEEITKDIQNEGKKQMQYSQEDLNE